MCKVYNMNKKFVKKADEQSLVHSLNVYEIYISRTNYTLYKDTHTYNIFRKQVLIILFLIIFFLVHMSITFWKL
jgi:hypothetical protein